MSWRCRAGPTYASLDATLKALGAETRHVVGEAELRDALRQPHSTSGLICDSSFRRDTCRLAGGA